MRHLRFPTSRKEEEFKLASEEEEGEEYELDMAKKMT